MATTSLGHSYDAKIQPQDPSHEPVAGLETVMGGASTLEIFQEAVRDARQKTEQSLVESGKVGEGVNLNLTIDLSRRSLGELPNGIVDIVKHDVERLHLSYNSLSTIPLRFQECSIIKYLNLRSNCFEIFPAAVYKLPYLEILDLSHNRLSMIPEGVGGMRALRALSLLHNRIENVPTNIASMDTLRMLKLGGNPLIPDLLRIIGEESLSTTGVVLPDNERDAIATRKLKKHLNFAGTRSRDSEGESSDGTVSTPRAPKRTLSARFPVKPNMSGSESASDLNLTLRSPGTTKPPIPARSHHRLDSSQNEMVINSALRRPGLTPLTSGNERNRSNSESLLQATQNNKSKRMGIVTRKQSDLSVVDESKFNRNSFHLRGQSHGSALQDRYTTTLRNEDTTPSSPLKNERHRGTFVRRLSSLPEHKREAMPSNCIAEGAKGVLYSLYQIHPHLTTLIRVVIGRTLKDQSHLERLCQNAFKKIEVLDALLHDIRPRRKQNLNADHRHHANIVRACHTIVKHYRDVGDQLLPVIHRLISGGEVRYVRTFVLLLYGSLIEARNAVANFELKRSRKGVGMASASRIPAIHEETRKQRERPPTPTKQRPDADRRWRNGIPAHRLGNGGTFSPTSGAQTAFPLHVNGRSRSNSRHAPLFGSAASSVANTPRSGESFKLPGLGTPRLRSRSNSALGFHAQTTAQLAEGLGHEAQFEKIFVSTTHCVEHIQNVIPLARQQFLRCLDVAELSRTSQQIMKLWSTLISRSTVVIETSSAMQRCLSTIKLNEPDHTQSIDFWRLGGKLLSCFEKLMSGVREGIQLHLISSDLIKIIGPLTNSCSQLARTIKDSPWEGLTEDGPDKAQQQQPQQQQQHQKTDGTARYRSRTGSGNSPYLTNVPPTPLSAALGPAAQATVPTSAAIDKSFEGDIFQRADVLLKSQQTMIHRR